MKSYKNKVAAITGAGSGIGRAIALTLAKDGCDLALSDVDQKGLAETVSLVEPLGVKCTFQPVDVANKDAVYQWANQVVADHGKVNMIMNNAGVGLGDTVETMQYDDFEWLMNINFWGVVYGTKAFLPYLKQSGEGHIINVSSVFGLIGVPTQSAYNAAKFAVKGFTESLREELEIEGACVSVSCVHPGGIKTNIAKNSRMGSVSKISTRATTPDQAAKQFEKIARTTPDEAAKIILDGVRKNKRRILVGFDAYMIDGMQRLLPTAYQKLLVMGVKRGG
ncbi:MAG: SDR family oxidoreductase [Pseudomonadales bacterium]|nr:SDR family oxidoreductase [Pseudomonadales bacterium]